MRPECSRLVDTSLQQLHLSALSPAKHSTPFLPLSPCLVCYLKPHETTCRALLILTANIYKNKQHELQGGGQGEGVRPGDTSLSPASTQGIPIFFFFFVPFAPLWRCFLFKYSRGRLIIATPSKGAGSSAGAGAVATGATSSKSNYNCAYQK